MAKGGSTCLLPLTIANALYLGGAGVTVLMAWGIWRTDSAIVAGSNFPRGAFSMSIFVAVLSILAIYAVCTKKVHFLRFYAGMLGIVVVIEIALGTIALINSIGVAGITSQLSDGWDRLRDTKSGREILLGLEHASDCCGFDTDKDRPQEPCEGPSGSLPGCKALLLKEQKSGFLIIAILLLGPALLQLFGVFAALVSAKNMAAAGAGTGGADGDDERIPLTVRG